MPHLPTYGTMGAPAAPGAPRGLIIRHADQLAATLNLRALRVAQKAGTAADFKSPTGFSFLSLTCGHEV
jgi:hypothetical protein